MTHSAMFIQN